MAGRMALKVGQVSFHGKGTWSGCKPLLDLLVNQQETILVVTFGENPHDFGF